MGMSQGYFKVNEWLDSVPMKPNEAKKRDN